MIGVYYNPKTNHSTLFWRAEVESAFRPTLVSDFWHYWYDGPGPENCERVFTTNYTPEEWGYEFICPFEGELCVSKEPELLDFSLPLSLG